MVLSKEEIGGIRHETQKTEHKAEKAINKKKPKINKALISVVVAIIVLFGVIGYGFLNSKKPGHLDDFAKCLTEKGAVMYGASWCQYTAAQKRMFGNSMRFVNYKDFSKNPEVKTTPTWFINGQKYEKTQSLERLAAVTGCKLP